MLDRALQRRILETLAALYPEGAHDLPGALGLSAADDGPDARAVLVNTQYLSEHGVLVSGYARRGMASDDSFMPMGEHVITAKGLDFLEDDGGLSAVLSTVTVRLAPAQWAELLARRVEADAKLSHDERTSIAATLRTLPAQAIEKLSGSLLDWAVDHLQDAPALLRTWLSQAAG